MKVNKITYLGKKIFRIIYFEIDFLEEFGFKKKFNFFFTILQRKHISKFYEKNILQSVKYKILIFWSFTTHPYFLKIRRKLPFCSCAFAVFLVHTHPSYPFSAFGLNINKLIRSFMKKIIMPLSGRK